MTGLDLEAFLKLHRADWGAWLSLGAIVGVLALMAWTSFGRRRVLRKCLVLSVAAHVGLIAYGGALPVVGQALSGRPESLLQPSTPIRVIVTASDSADGSAQGSDSGRKSKRREDFDRPSEAVALGDPSMLDSVRPSARIPLVDDRQPQVLATSTITPKLTVTGPSEPTAPAPSAPVEPSPTSIVSSDLNELLPAPAPRAAAPTENGSGLLGDRNLSTRVRDGSSSTIKPVAQAKRSLVAIGPAVAPITPLPGTFSPPSPRTTLADQVVDPPPGIENPSFPSPAESPTLTATEPEVDPAIPEFDLRRQTRPGRSSTELTVSKPANTPLPTLASATPSTNPGLGMGTQRGVPNGFLPIEIPKIYKSRLDPKRSELAQKAGASLASEQSVERALEWLKRHQDADGRWDGGTAKYDDGRVVARDDNFTTHCPPGDICAGECLYHDADTALTALSLLAYLGAGYTHTDGGKYSETVSSGLSFLVKSQKADGDLRGQSTAVGMYCHAMASLALSEAYALTGDVKLRSPVERAIAFLVRGQAADGMAWRYAPRASSGDTSLLGWVILVIKSAGEVGIPVPATTRSGAMKWLKMVADGTHGGLAKYQPNKPVTPTMTAEAWVCRQFLGIGGPGPASSEAADYLIKHSPNIDTYNLYYWYYGTLALFQHGGPTWEAWNRQVRDQLVKRQRASGHALGSWDPDQTEYGVLGGRIYSTAVATLTLEVYYRYLRLYDLPTPPTPTTDPATRRAAGK